MVAALLLGPPAGADSSGPRASRPKVAAKAGDSDEDAPRLVSNPPRGKRAAAADAKPDAPYQGVAPGGAALPPHASRPGASRPAKMLWPGFQVRDGVPTVFVELTAPVEWSVADSGRGLVYTLKDTTIPLRNNTRPLRVAEFGTDVESVDVRKAGRDVRITIATKRKVGHLERTEEAAGGYKLLLVELSPHE